MATYVSRLYKNAIKAENEVIKASINNDKPFNWYYGEYTEGNQKYNCLTEGHVLIAFGFNTFVISKEIFEINNKVLNNIAQLINKESLSYEPAQLIGTRLAEDTFCVLKKESTGEEIFFNEKYKKYFPDDVEYKVLNAVTPIKVYSGDVFLGVIMPKIGMPK